MTHKKTNVKMTRDIMVPKSGFVGSLPFLCCLGFLHKQHIHERLSFILLLFLPLETNLPQYIMLLLAQQGSIKDKWSNIRAWFKCHTTSSSSPTSNDCTKRKLQQLLLFKRRAYNPMMNDDDDLDIRKEAEKIYRLYDLAADEVR